MPSMFAMTTDYISSSGDPMPALEAIAAAGFSSVHWCHQWNSDFIYCGHEIAAIKRRLGELCLHVNDMHASHGNEKGWCSAVEYQRLAGLELVVNRLEMAAELDCPVAILHLPEPFPGVPGEDGAGSEAEAWWSRVRRSLDALVPHVRRTGVRIAVENMPRAHLWAALEQVLAEYPADVVGLCYDAGHGTLSSDGLERLEQNKSRLIALHLHDNDGVGDLHWLPFEGPTNWQRLAEIIVSSGYDRPVMTIESNMKSPPHKGTDGTVWLAKAAEAGRRLAGVFAAARAADIRHQ